MTQRKSAKAKQKHGDEPYTNLYENGFMRVFKTPSGQVLVEDIRSGAEMRISQASPASGLEFTTNGVVEPVRSKDLTRWRVTRRR